MNRQRLAAGALIAAAGLASYLVARAVMAAQRHPSRAATTDVAEPTSDDAPAPGDVSAGGAGAGSAPSLAPRASRVRALAAENFHLRRELQELQQTLAAATGGAAVVPGLPVRPPGLASAAENRTMKEIGDRVFSEHRPRFDRLHAETTGAAPPASMTTEEVMSALMDATGVTDVDVLRAEIKSTEALIARGAPPPGPEAPLLRRVTHALMETGDAMERSLGEALPPDRIAALKASGRSGFGIGINRQNDRWIVRQSLLGEK